jgi:VCBS repeat-containing protein
MARYVIPKRYIVIMCILVGGWALTIPSGVRAAIPESQNDLYSTNEDTVLTVAAPGVLANDTDADGDPLSAALESAPSHGTVTLNADGSFAYTPAPDYNGSDSFTYVANDGFANSNVATVTIDVSSVNDVPTANFTYTINANTVDFTDTSSDVDGTIFSWSWDFGDGSVSNEQNPSHSYTAIGTSIYTVTLTVTDNDGAVDTFSVIVAVTYSPVDAIDDLQNAVIEMGGLEELAQILDHAAALLDDDNPNNDQAVCGKLQSFINGVKSLEKDGDLGADDADSLIGTAEDIKAFLGC